MSTSTPGGSSGNPGIVDLEVSTLDVRPQPVLNAVEVEIANPAGDGVRLYLDLGLTLDFAMRLVGSAMRLRKSNPQLIVTDISRMTTAAGCIWFRQAGGFDGTTGITSCLRTPGAG